MLLFYIYYTDDVCIKYIGTFKLQVPGTSGIIKLTGTRTRYKKFSYLITASSVCFCFLIGLIPFFSNLIVTLVVLNNSFICMVLFVV